MGLKLKNEFTVSAPLDQTWKTLLDISRVAGCMPGAKIESGGEDGVYRGTMKVKLGPMNIAYQGVAKLAEVDEDNHICTLDVKAKEKRGTGTASATITNRLSETSGGTKVEVVTDLAITGRQAQFGRGIMEDVSAKMLDDFATRLEREILSGGQPAAAPGGESPVGVATAAPPAAGMPLAAAQPPPAQPAPAAAAPVSFADDDDDNDVLDLGSVVGGPVAKRAAIGAGVGAVLLLIVLALLSGRSRRGLELKLNMR